MKKVYAGIVLAGMLAAVLFMTGCSNPTSNDPVYSIALDQTGSVVFNPATAGYAAQAAKTVTVTNTGNQPTGALAVESSSTSFRVSLDSLPSIDAGGTASFTVFPRTGLQANAAPYTATITVSGGNSIGANFSVSFTVNPRAEHGVSLDKTDLVFPAGTVDEYGPQTPQTVTVSNTGNQATGTLAIENSNAAGFTVTPASLPSLAPGATGDITVTPVVGLPIGRHSATITVRGENNISASFSANFRVTPTDPVYGITLDKSGTVDFPSGATAGYPEQTPVSVTVANEGNRATGSLTVRASGADSGSFAVSQVNPASIEIGGTGVFTVAPRRGLAARTYAATITVSGGNGISESFDVRFTVDPTYGISLSRTEPYAFPRAAFGYGEQTANALAVTVRNTGDDVTGALTASASGTDFTVSPASLPSIAVGGNAAFTVVPKPGLAAGAHAATITVSGENNVSESFAVSFAVEGASYGISLSETETSAFPEVFYGYGAQAAKGVTIANTGNQATGALNVALSGANASDYFELPATSIASIPGGETGSFAVVPKDGLGSSSADATYTATITVSGGANITSKSFAVSFKVKAIGAPEHGIRLGVSGTYSFPAAVHGYVGTPMPRTVAVNNTGNQVAGPLAITLSGADSGSFTLSTNSIANIGLSVSESFTVGPNAGLSGRALPYTAIITVDDTHGNSETFDVSFTVAEPTYGISLSGTGAFPDAYFGYAPLAARTVTIKNTRNQPTGPLTITGLSNFTVSKTGSGAIADIAAGASDSFTVVPNTGLGIAAYNETIGVTGGNGITGSLAVSFEVTPAPVYGISLDHSGTHTFPAAIVGYPAQASETVTVSNLGDDVKGTGPLTIANSNPNGFRLSRNSLAIANGGAAVFTVVPNGNLGAGTHKSDITVGDTHGNSETFEVSFTVNPVVYTVAFNAPGNSPATWVEQVIRNSTVTLPMEPTRIGYTFGGWYTTPETGGSKFDATAGVTRDWTLYARWLSSNASLAALSVSSGDLIHLYDTTYSVEVPNAVASIEVRATKADGNAVLAQYPSNNPVSLNVGSNIITVRVAAPDKTTATDYTIIVVRQQPQSNNANLSSLGVSVGALSPAFSADRTAYTVSVPSTTGAITVAAVKADARSELTQSPGTLGSPVALAESTTKITLAVKAENGAAKTYTITVNKAESDDNNAVNVAIGIGDANIDLTRDTANDLSQEAGDVLNLTAPSGGIYHWWVDNVDNGAAEGITLNAGGYGYGTHSVLLQFVKDGATYGCEVQFRVVR